MRPITLPQATSLLDVKPPMTGVENDPVLAERKAQFDRNLPEFLRRPFKNRGEFEQGITQIPGAGAEILGHIQQRAIENMPTEMRREWEQSKAIRQATAKAITAAAADEASYQQFLKTAEEQNHPEWVTRFHENYERTPDGWKPVRMMPWEKAAAARENFYAANRNRPEVIAEFEENYIWTPDGAKRRNPPGYISFGTPAQGKTTDFVKHAETRPPGGQMPDARPSYAQGATAGARQTSFQTEAGAMAAGLPAGTLVYIAGRPAIIE